MKVVSYAVMLLLVAGAVGPAGADDSSLSPAQNKVIAAKIAKLRYPQERELARGWSDAKKVAEELCRPAARQVLRRQVRGADRFFLGTDATDTLTLEGNTRLTGTGSVRSPSGWRDFTFECRLNPQTGGVTKFLATLKP
jgi:hypothetical protein